MAAKNGRKSKRRRRAKPLASADESKVRRLLQSDFQRASKKFAEDLTNYSWNWDESPFREMDNGKCFRDATQQLLDSLKSAIQKRFAQAWALYRNKPKASQADAAESSRKLIRNSVALCWSLKAVLRKVPPFTVMEHIVPIYLPPGLPDVEPLCTQTDNDVLSHVDRVADSVVVAGIVEIDPVAMLGERASQLYDDLKKLQKFCGRSIPDEKKLRLEFPLSIWTAIDESPLAEEERKHFFTEDLKNAGQSKMFSFIGKILGHSESETYAAYKHYRNITGIKRMRRPPSRNTRRRKRR